MSKDFKVCTDKDYHLSMITIGNLAKMSAFRVLIGPRMKDIFKNNLAKKFHLLNMRDKLASVQKKINSIMQDLWEKYTGKRKILDKYTYKDIKLDEGEDLESKYAKLSNEIEDFYKNADSDITIKKLKLTSEESSELTIEEISLLRDFVEFEFDDESRKNNETDRVP